jgi:hypothetical protein
LLEGTSQHALFGAPVWLTGVVSRPGQRVSVPDAERAPGGERDELVNLRGSGPSVRSEIQLLDSVFNVRFEATRIIENSCWFILEKCLKCIIGTI